MRKYFKKLITPLFGTITHVSTTEKIAALTFDDGPHKEFTPRLLDILDRYNAKGTFFVLGELAAKYPEIIQRMGTTGHTVACHSWDHPAFPRVSRSERLIQLKKSVAVFNEFNQHLFRPPFGFEDLRTSIDVFMQGYKTIGWNLHADDWTCKDGQTMAQTLINQISPGCIILMHDNLYKYDKNGWVDRNAALEAVEQLLAKKSNEFRFVTVTELLKQGKAQKKLISRKGDPEFLAGLMKS